MEYCLATKRNELQIHNTTHMNLIKTLCLVKEDRIKGHTIYDLFKMKYIEEANPQRQKVDQWLSGTKRREDLRVTANGNGDSSKGDKKGSGIREW